MPLPRSTQPCKVLGVAVEVASLRSTSDRVLSLVKAEGAAFICFTTAYMLVKATRDRAIQRMYSQCDLISADGTPVAWCLRLLGHPKAECVSGPRLTPLLLKEAAEQRIAVGFYGGRPGTLALLQRQLERTYPNLRVAYLCSPPFSAITAEQQETLLTQIRNSGTQMLFVGLGSPKQDLWMYRHAPSLNCVCLGVGAAFEFISGEKKLPPLWVQNLGLTWLVRLCQEPRRLFIRNLYSPIFAIMFCLQRLFGVSFASAANTSISAEAAAE